MQARNGEGRQQKENEQKGVIVGIPGLVGYGIPAIQLPSVVSHIVQQAHLASPCASQSWSCAPPTTSCNAVSPAARRLWRGAWSCWWAIGLYQPLWFCILC